MRETDIVIAPVIGPRERHRQETLSAMEKVLRCLRWDKVKKVVPLDTNLPPPTIIQSSSAWKSAVLQARQLILDMRAHNIPSNVHEISQTRLSHIQNNVVVLDKSYLEKSFRSSDPEWSDVIGNVSTEFQLNREQDCAFRIVANHVCISEGSDQLNMYIGGMGGTGKSQVLKALMRFFILRQEAYRFVVVAPTGNAASLLGGSTYHYLFGINDRDSSPSVLAQVKSRLIGVEYVFFDEVLMLSCRDLYRISARLAVVLGNAELPFGGMNMIFAGDFAQLPPAIGRETASLYSRTV